MKNSEYLTIAQVAKILRITRIAVYKKVKKGEIEAIRIGKIFAIPRNNIIKKIRKVKGHSLSEGEKSQIQKAVTKTMNEYGEVLKKLGAG